MQTDLTTLSLEQLEQRREETLNAYKFASGKNKRHAQLDASEAFSAINREINARKQQI